MSDERSGLARGAELQGFRANLSTSPAAVLHGPLISVHVCCWRLEKSLRPYSLSHPSNCHSPWGIHCEGPCTNPPPTPPTPPRTGWGNATRPATSFTEKKRQHSIKPTLSELRYKTTQNLSQQDGCLPARP